MNILLDMNIPLAWIPILEEAGYVAVHWSNVGSIYAPDVEIMKWAREYDFIVFTHDLDFGAILFATQAKAPSVIQMRNEDIRPHVMGDVVLDTLKKVEKEMKNGVLVTIHPRKSRIRILPFKRKNKD